MSTVTATVKIALKLKINSTWGEDCSVAQVKKQAIAAANSMINQSITNDPDIEITGNTEYVNINFNA